MKHSLDCASGPAGDEGPCDCPKADEIRVSLSRDEAKCLHGEYVDAVTNPDFLALERSAQEKLAVALAGSSTEEGEGETVTLVRLGAVGRWVRPIVDVAWLERDGWEVREFRAVPDERKETKNG